MIAFPIPARRFCVAASAVCMLSLMSAVTASAESCPNAQAREQTHAVSLPDCRAYEQVTPVVKNGNEAGVEVVGGESPSPGYATASADGEGIFFGSSRSAITGALGETDAGVNFFWVSARGHAGWSTRAPLPPGNKETLNEKENEPTLDVPKSILPSTDLSTFVFAAVDAFGAAPASVKANAYRVNLAAKADWLSRPTVSNPPPALSETTDGEEVRIVGASPDLQTVYLAYPGTLVPEDEAPDPQVEGLSRADVVAGKASPDLGLYEWQDGVLRSGATLPDGSVDPYGAIPASTLEFGTGATPFDYAGNQVNKDGSEMLFVSPDPISNAPLTDVPELYVRETTSGGGHRSVLVSRSMMTGAPSPRPPTAVHDPAPVPGGNGTSYGYMSPDGSRIYFGDTAQLTANAPADESAKEYAFDVGKEQLHYLPGVAGSAPGAAESNNSPVIASAADGSRVLFERLDPDHRMLELWAEGSLSVVSELPPPPGTPLVIAPARSDAAGGVFVFETNSRLPGGFNNSGGFEQVYRYVVATNKLDCVSCPPRGVAASGNAHMSNDVARSGVLDARGVSNELNRVFFDTPDPLTSADTNGKRDVYEWDNGETHLLSSGTGSGDSFLMDNSEDGRDVFFATRDALVNSDTDGGYDIYDAREGGGFIEPAPASACGAECSQGSGAPPVSLAGAPSSATFTGEGNLGAPASSTPKPKTAAQIRAEHLRRALKACRAKHGHARTACEHAARRRFGPTKTAKTTGRNR